MNLYRKNAIIVGVLFIAAIVVPLLSMPFSGFVDDPEDLIKVAENENQVIIGAILELIFAFACGGIAIWMFPVIRKYNESLALGSVGARLAEAIFYLIGMVGLLLIVTLSGEFVKSGAPDASHFQSLGTILLAVREWTGMTGSIAFILGALMYYYIFFKSQLIPRWLAIWGLIGVPFWIAAELLVMFGVIESLSANVVFLQLIIAANEIVLAVWLIAKGFNPSAIASLSAKTDINTG